MRGLILLLAALPLWPQGHDHRHPPHATGQYARMLENPSRDEWQRPDAVVDVLEIKPEEIIADIGAGTGYFARRLAAKAAKVYAVDIDEKLLERAAEGAPPNLVTVLAAPEDPKLPDAGVDTVFFCNVLHHVGGRPAYYAKLDRALRPGGRMVVIDFYKHDLPVGPRSSMKISEEQVVAEFEAAGFRRTASHGFLLYQYFLAFERAR